MLAICDVNNPLAIAGVMGDRVSITNNTTAIILSANFARDNIRQHFSEVIPQSDSSIDLKRYRFIFSRNRHLVSNSAH